VNLKVDRIGVKELAAEANPGNHSTDSKSLKKNPMRAVPPGETNVDIL
jgi:hypothetical protein